VTSRSIFQKICPDCMNTLALDSHHCACGHQFDHDNNEADLSSEEIRLQAEELYENYLAARVEQSTAAIQAAEAEHNRDPENMQKAFRVTDLINESEDARRALAAQSARVAEIKKSLAQTAPVAAPVLATKAAPERTIPAPIPEARKPSPVRAVPRVAAAPVNPKPNGTPVDHGKRTARPSVWVSTNNTTAAPKQPVPAKPIMTSAQEPVQQSRTSSAAFRQAQAAKAEQILRKSATNTAVHAVIKEETIAQSKTVATPKKEPETMAPQPLLARSAPRLIGAEKKDCPNCTASVDNHIERCRCGYEFSKNEIFMPSLSMSDEERAEFVKLFNFP